MTNSICKECGDEFIAIPSIFEYCPKCAIKLGLICEKCGKWKNNCICKEKEKGESSMGLPVGEFGRRQRMMGGFK